jgi:arylsulfatase A-like enzyme
MTENLDENVGKLMSFLKEERLLDNTIVVFIADHGELGGSHCLAEKQHPYEESIGIPMIISGPGIVSGNCLDVPACSEDLFPTILGLAKLKPQKRCQGTDLSPLICGEADTIDRPGVLLQFIWETRADFAFHGQTWRGFRSKRYKYNVLGDFKNGIKPWQFFDLKNDPGELNNLLDNPEYKDLISIHHNWMCERMLEIGDDALEYIKKPVATKIEKYHDKNIYNNKPALELMNV